MRRFPIILVIFVFFLTGCTTTADSSQEAPIGIITALDSELELLLENAEISHSDKIGGNVYHVGSLHGKPVVLVKAGVGKSMSAAGAGVLISKYDVAAIIFSGVAGGVGDETKVLDIVISDSLVMHDYGAMTNDGGFEWMPARGTDEGYIQADKALADLAYDTAATVVGDGNVHRGTIATGDQFVASSEYVSTLQEKFNALACEMEGASVALVASSCNVPFVVIRCMSDKADGYAVSTFTDFLEIASDNSATIVMGMLESM